jgi:hypothetical protein
VWCETLAFHDLPPALPVLARYGVDLLLAVRPWHLAEVRATVARAKDAGLYVAVWPMLADEHGRWASVSTAVGIAAFGDELLATDADELVLDLEPPIEQMTRLKQLRPVWTARSGFAAARDGFRALIARWRPRRVTTAVMPFVAGTPIDRLLGTPTDLPVDRHSVMAYTSLFEGWSRGFVGRRRAELLLAASARVARLRFGERAGISLGTVGNGAFGDEPGYRDVSELARDVAIARAAGITELSLFDLGGVVRRGPVESWLEALHG